MEIETLFQRRGKVWIDLVKNGNKEAFVQRMKALRNSLEDGNPNFGKAYNNMYKIAEEL
jgi:hypothetical protein